MKVSCGQSWKVRFDAKHKWHRWFAWRPVRVGEHDCRWLEFIERRGIFWDCLGYGGWNWEFRSPQVTTTPESSDGV